MTVRAYVFITGTVGRQTDVAREIRGMKLEHAKVVSSDFVIGPFDIIVMLEGDDLHKLSHVIREHIEPVDGVEKTMTCLPMHEVGRYSRREEGPGE
jgi:DNA-binding Lrp family transcriptional regulator